MNAVGCGIGVSNRLAPAVRANLQQQANALARAGHNRLYFSMCSVSRIILGIIAIWRSRSDVSSLRWLAWVYRLVMRGTTPTMQMAKVLQVTTYPSLQGMTIVRMTHVLGVAQKRPGK